MGLSLIATSKIRKFQRGFELVTPKAPTKFLLQLCAQLSNRLFTEASNEQFRNAPIKNLI